MNSLGQPIDVDDPADAPEPPVRVAVTGPATVSGEARYRSEVVDWAGRIEVARMKTIESERVTP